jgi:hypothetical protein
LCTTRGTFECDSKADDSNRYTSNQEIENNVEPPLEAEEYIIWLLRLLELGDIV